MKQHLEELLIEMHGDVKVLVNNQENHGKRLEKVEKRLDTYDAIRNRIAGAIFVVASIAGAASHFVTAKLKTFFTAVSG